MPYPTGISLRSEEARSQSENRKLGMARLKAKLVAVAEEQRARDVADIRGDIVKADFGQQIRNYVMFPYKMVKDVRTGVETSDVDGVMAGGLLRTRTRPALNRTTESVRLYEH